MDLNQICHHVVALAREAGDFLVTESRTFKSHQIETKGLNDFVSYVDKESEKMIVEGLRKILPHSGFIAEEGTGDRVEGGYNWIIDPLDGTTNFVHGIPFYAVSIALESPDKELLIGVVHEPNHNECFYAVKDGGAFLNGKPIQVSPAEDISRGLLATGFPYSDFKQMPQYILSLRELMQKCHGLRRIGSAALDLAYVACGRFEAFFEYNLRPWDVAAGTLLVREAGGKATTFQDGIDCVFGKEIIASGIIHHELLAIINKHFYGEEGKFENS